MAIGGTARRDECVRGGPCGAPWSADRIGGMRLVGAEGVVGRFRILGELGRGGMGRVLLASAPDGRLVAVKQVHPHFLADEGFRERFRREVQASRRVSGAYTAAVVGADTEAE